MKQLLTTTAIAALLLACSTSPTVEIANKISTPQACVDEPLSDRCLDHRAVRACWFGLGFIAVLRADDKRDFEEDFRVEYMRAEMAKLHTVARTSKALELDLASVRKAFVVVTRNAIRGVASSLSLTQLLDTLGEALIENEFYQAGRNLILRQTKKLDEDTITVDQSWVDCMSETDRISRGG